MTNPIQLAPFAFAFVLIAAASAQADLHTLVLDGQLEAPGGTRTATLHFVCETDSDGGAVSVELWVPQAFKLKDFDYDDFEGPDAAARERALSRLSVSGEASSKEIAHAASGWYTADDAETFAFGVSQLSHRKGDLATLLGAIDAKRAKLVWVQTGFDDPKRELRATFSLDAAAVKRIRDTVDGCLAPAKSKEVKK